MKVEEAKEKKCCNGMSIVGGNGHCIIDQCMAWRWNYEAMVIGETIGGTKILANGKGLISETDGYCGLAGKEWAE